MTQKSIFLLFLPILFFFGCNQKDAYKIGISQCSEDDWRIKMNNEINREMVFHPEAKVEIRSADDNSEKQISDIRYFIENDFDIIVVAPNEAEALTPIIREAYESDIPIVVFDRDINGKYFTAFQGADNYAIGAQAAEYLNSHLSGKFNILEIWGLKGSTPAEGRHSGFIEKLSKLQGGSFLIPVTGNWNYEEAYAAVDSILAGGQMLDAIYAHNDRMAIAAADASEKYGLDPIIIGIDAAPEIGMRAVADGKLDATFLYPTEGALLVKTALAILKDEPFDEKIILPVNPPVTRDNVGVLLLQNEELKRETQHLETLKSQLDEHWKKNDTYGMVIIAAIIIIILAAIIIYAILRAVWTHKRNREELARHNAQLERQKNELVELNEKLNQATQSKLDFFTSVSHDLRTPITLISEPISDLADSSNLTPQQKNLVVLADKNIKILKRLVNNILDFRKYENGKMKLNLVEVNLGRMVNSWILAFVPLARRRHLELRTDIDFTSDSDTAIDPVKMESVFFNLVSNAFKYTPDNGTITIICKRKEDNMIVQVADTGKGINAEDMKNIFENFYQAETLNPAGSGIGLSLAKAFVEMHSGTIEVESEPGKGAKFTVTLPVKHVADKPVEVESNITQEDVTAEQERIEKRDFKIDPDKPVLLVIDDNEDICNMINEMLGEEYNIISASNGKSGLRMATRYIPDIIVCDVMMPVMDGLECCRRLKEEVSTCHIPVIMLTACSLDEQRVEGFESGVDGYMSKPFSMKVLKSHLKTLINNRRLIKDLWKADVGKEDNSEIHKDTVRLEKAVSGMDSEFYHRFLSMVKENMSDPELNVDRLAKDLGFARSQFYRKIKALTNYSPVELLRRLRLKHARELLTTTEKTISEIGYEVGFSSAAYFTKCYRDEFGETPSQLRERLGYRA